MNRWRSSNALIALFVLLSLTFPIQNICLAKGGFLDPISDRGTLVGIPRFKKRKETVFYIGIGVGLNPYDEISNTSYLGLSGSIIKDLNQAIGGIPTHMPTTGIPYLIFGFIPGGARFLRNNIELSFKLSPNSINASNDDPVKVNGTDYSSLSLYITNIRVLYELYFQMVLGETKFMLFAGGGFGFSPTITSLSGTTPSTTTPSGGTDQPTGNDIKIASQTEFSLAFSASCGTVINVMKGFGVEVKGRYIALMTPFGLGNGTFDLYRSSIEISVSALVKI